MAEQIDEFDSTAAETAEDLKSQSKGAAWEAEAVELAGALDGYDFDQAESLLSQITEKLSSADSAPRQSATETSELIKNLESLSRQIEDHDAMIDLAFDQLLKTSAWLRTQPSADSLKRSISAYDYSDATLRLESLLLTAREIAESDDNG